MPHIDPDPENWALFKSLPRDRPIHLLNMIRYREKAAYPPGHASAASGLSGEQAFDAYLEAVVPRIEALGGGLVWNSRFECMITGPRAFEWDRVFVMGFPAVAPFFALLTDPGYKSDVLVHRTAAVADSRLVRFAG